MYLIPASSVHRNRWKVTSLSSSIWFRQTDKGAFYHNFTAEVSVAACCFQQETIVFYFQRSLKCITIEDSIFANISSNKIKGKAIPRECLNAKENNISFLYIESIFFFSWRLSTDNHNKMMLLNFVFLYKSGHYWVYWVWGWCNKFRFDR